METGDVDSLIERIAEAVVNKIDEREKINLIAQAVLERLQEMDKSARSAWNVPDGTPSYPDVGRDSESKA
jgi:hypothetical protein